MSLHRWNAKRDTVEPAIVDALELAGAEVFRISGPGLPDLLVRYRGCLYAGEVKTRKGVDKRQTKQIAAAFPRWMTPEDALRAIGAAR